MIQEFSVSPKPTNKKAKVVFFSLLGLSALVVVAYVLLDHYKGVVGLGAIGMLTAAILIYTKYLSPKFYYDITFDDKNVALFVVRQTTGKRTTTLCNIYLHSIIKIEKETAKERKNHVTPKNYVRYNYTPTMTPDVVYRITSSSHYEQAEIVIEGSEDYIRTLNAYVKEARELYQIEEDNYEEDQTRPYGKTTDKKDDKKDN